MRPPKTIERAAESRRTWISVKKIVRLRERENERMGLEGNERKLEKGRRERETKED